MIGGLTASRRRFLGLFGAGAAAAPLAAKAALETQQASVSSLMRGFYNPLVQSATSDGTAAAPPSSELQNTSYDDTCKMAAQYVRILGVPPHVQEVVRRNSQNVSALDPDLAFAKRSWSMNVKIAEQRQRNYQREIGNVLGHANRHLSRSAFQKLTGFNWPW